MKEDFFCSSSSDNSEKWKDIPGYSGFYEASTYGNIKSYRKHRFNTEVPHILSAVKNKKGYLIVCLTSQDGKTHTKSVHRLIAETFIPNPLLKKQINHIDLNKTNNHVENLEWCDNSENMKHAVLHGVITNKNAVEKIKKPIRCIELDKVFSSAREAAKKLDISFVSIGQVCLKKRKTAGGFHFEFI